MKKVIILNPYIQCLTYINYLDIVNYDQGGIGIQSNKIKEIKDLFTNNSLIDDDSNIRKQQRTLFSGTASLIEEDDNIRKQRNLFSGNSIIEEDNIMKGRNLFSGSIQKIERDKNLFQSHSLLSDIRGEVNLNMF